MLLRRVAAAMMRQVLNRKASGPVPDLLIRRGRLEARDEHGSMLASASILRVRHTQLSRRHRLRMRGSANKTIGKRL